MVHKSHLTFPGYNTYVYDSFWFLFGCLKGPYLAKYGISENVKKYSATSQLKKTRAKDEFSRDGRVQKLVQIIYATRAKLVRMAEKSRVSRAKLVLKVTSLVTRAKLVLKVTSLVIRAKLVKIA